MILSSNTIVLTSHLVKDVCTMGYITHPQRVAALSSLSHAHVMHTKQTITTPTAITAGAGRQPPTSILFYTPTSFPVDAADNSVAAPRVHFAKDLQVLFKTKWCLPATWLARLRLPSAGESRWRTRRYVSARLYSGACGPRLLAFSSESRSIAVTSLAHL